MGIEDDQKALRQACDELGLDSNSLDPIRIAENSVWRLPHGIVARMTSRKEAVHREIRVARWLGKKGVSAVRPDERVPEQPVIIGERAISFWEELPPHQHGTCFDMAPLLKQLHRLDPPDFLGKIDPFGRTGERIDKALTLNKADRDWLRGYYAELRVAWDAMPEAETEVVVHGDAWSGNCVVADDGTAYLLDFDSVAIGLPEWDLTSISMALTLTGALSAEDYSKFCEIYGKDVTQWKGYETLRSIREMRMALWSASVAAVRPEWCNEVQHRIDCLRGKKGPRPWKWTAIM